MPILNVNTEELRNYSRKLDGLHRSAFPTAVRNSLNSAAFDVKQNTLLKVTKHKFDNRSSNFFKANSVVEKATGWSVSQMASTVGMSDNRKKGTNDHAVRDLEQQEHGGKIKGKSFIPMNTSRTGKSHARNVAARNRLSSVGNLINSRNSKGKTKQARFMVAVRTAGVGGFVLGDRNIVWRVDGLTRKRNGLMKITPLYSFRRNRSISVSKTKFMEHSVQLSAKKIPLFYKKEAEKQFKKYLA